MPTFNEAEIKAYSNGEVTSSKRVGYLMADDANKTIALPFKTGSAGASKFKFEITLSYNIYNQSESPAGRVAFAITTTDDEFYKNHNGNGDGLVDIKSNDFAENYYDLSATVEKVLMPDKEYVLWLFPNYTEKSVLLSIDWNESSKRNYELIGAAGLVNIGNKSAMPYIGDGEKWVFCTPNIFNEKKWDICS